jgi:DNA-binding protein YbaB
MQLSKEMAKKISELGPDRVKFEPTPRKEIMDWADKKAQEINESWNERELSLKLEDYLKDIAQALREAYLNGLTKALEISMDEHGEEPIVAPLTNAAYDEAARTISNRINEEIGKTRLGFGSNDPFL